MRSLLEPKFFFDDQRAYKLQDIYFLIGENYFQLVAEQIYLLAPERIEADRVYQVSRGKTSLTLWDVYCQEKDPTLVWIGAGRKIIPADPHRNKQAKFPSEEQIKRDISRATDICGIKNTYLRQVINEAIILVFGIDPNLVEALKRIRDDMEIRVGVFEFIWGAYRNGILYLDELLVSSHSPRNHRELLLTLIHEARVITYPKSTHERNENFAQWCLRDYVPMKTDFKTSKSDGYQAIPQLPAVKKKRPARRIAYARVPARAVAYSARGGKAVCSLDKTVILNLQQAVEIFKKGKSPAGFWKHVSLEAQRGMFEIAARELKKHPSAMNTQDMQKRIKALGEKSLYGMLRSYLKKGLSPSSALDQLKKDLGIEEYFLPDEDAVKLACGRKKIPRWQWKCFSLTAICRIFEIAARELEKCPSELNTNDMQERIKALGGKFLRVMVSALRKKGESLLSALERLKKDTGLKEDFMPDDRAIEVFRQVKDLNRFWKRVSPKAKRRMIEIAAQEFTKAPAEMNTTDMGRKIKALGNKSLWGMLGSWRRSGETYVSAFKRLKEALANCLASAIMRQHSVSYGEVVSAFDAAWTINDPWNFKKALVVVKRNGGPPSFADAKLDRGTPMPDFSGKTSDLLKNHGWAEGIYVKNNGDGTWHAVAVGQTQDIPRPCSGQAMHKAQEEQKLKEQGYIHLPELDESKIGEEDVIGEDNDIDESEAGQLSEKIVRPLFKKFYGGAHHLFVDITVGASVYAFERVLKTKKRFYGRYWVEEDLCLARVGPAFFIGREIYKNLDPDFKKALGNKVVLFDEAEKIILEDWIKLGNYTMVTIAAMLNINFKGMRVIDAGSCEGILSLVALKQGARFVHLIEIYECHLEHARRLLVLNGYEEGVHFKLHCKDLKDKEAIAKEIEGDQRTAIISNIGSWESKYSVDNQDSMALMDLIPNVQIFIAGGYHSSEIPAMSKDQEKIQEMGFMILPDVAVMGKPYRGLFAWVAERLSGEKAQKDFKPGDKNAGGEISAAFAALPFIPLAGEGAGFLSNPFLWGAAVIFITFHIYLNWKDQVLRKIRLFLKHRKRLKQHVWEYKRLKGFMIEVIAYERVLLLFTGLGILFGKAVIVYVFLIYFILAPGWIRARFMKEQIESELEGLTGRRISRKHEIDAILLNPRLAKEIIEQWDGDFAFSLREGMRGAALHDKNQKLKELCAAVVSVLRGGISLPVEDLMRAYISAWAKFVPGKGANVCFRFGFGLTKLEREIFLAFIAHVTGYHLINSYRDALRPRMKYLKKKMGPLLPRIRVRDSKKKGVFLSDITAFAFLQSMGWKEKIPEYVEQAMQFQEDADNSGWKLFKPWRRFQSRYHRAAREAMRDASLSGGISWALVLRKGIGSFYADRKLSFKKFYERLINRRSEIQGGAMIPFVRAWLGEKNAFRWQALLEQVFFGALNVALIPLLGVWAATLGVWALFVALHFVRTENMPQAPPLPGILVMACLNAFVFIFLLFLSIYQIDGFLLITLRHCFTNCHWLAKQQIPRGIRILAAYNHQNILSQKGKDLLEGLERIQQRLLTEKFAVIALRREIAELVSMIPSREKLDLDLFVEVLDHLPELVRDFLFGYYEEEKIVRLPLTSGCPRGCVFCCVDGKGRPLSMPYPMLIKIIDALQKEGQLEGRKIILHEAGDPFDYHDEILDADLSDVMRFIFQKRLKDSTYCLITQGWEKGSIGERAAKRMRKFPYPPILNLSFHLYYPLSFRDLGRAKELYKGHYSHVLRTYPKAAVCIYYSREGFFPEIDEATQEIWKEINNGQFKGRFIPSQSSDPFTFLNEPVLWKEGRAPLALRDAGLDLSGQDTMRDILTPCILADGSLALNNRSPAWVQSVGDIFKDGPMTKEFREFISYLRLIYHVRADLELFFTALKKNAIDEYPVDQLAPEDRSFLAEVGLVIEGQEGTIAFPHWGIVKVLAEFFVEEKAIQLLANAKGALSSEQISVIYSALKAMPLPVRAGIVIKKYNAERRYHFPVTRVDMDGWRHYFTTMFRIFPAPGPQASGMASPAAFAFSPLIPLAGEGEKQKDRDVSNAWSLQSNKDPQQVVKLVTVIQTLLRSQEFKYPVWLFGSSAVFGVREDHDIDLGIHADSWRREGEKTFYFIKALRLEFSPNDDHRYGPMVRDVVDLDKFLEKTFDPLRHGVMFRITENEVCRITESDQMLAFLRIDLPHMKETIDRICGKNEARCPRSSSDKEANLFLRFQLILIRLWRWVSGVLGRRLRLQ
ncbi:MAG: hypothetical protein WC552_04585 [Candidatus Omnitrophota bacterium]